MDFVRYPVKTYLMEVLCDGCSSGTMKFISFQKDGCEHQCTDCGAIRLYPDKYPVIQYVKDGDVEYV